VQINDEYSTSFPVQTIQLPRDPSKIIDSNYFYQKFIPQGDGGTFVPTYLLSIHKWEVLRNSIQRDDYVLLDMPQQIRTKNLLQHAAHHLAHYLQILRLKPNAAAPSVFVDTSKLLDLHSFFPMRRTFPEIRWEAIRGKWVLPCISCPRFAENVAKAASLEQREKRSTIAEYLNCMHLRQAYEGEVPLVQVDIMEVTTNGAQLERELIPCVQQQGTSLNPHVQELAKKCNYSEKILKLHRSTGKVIEGLADELQGKILSFLPIFQEDGCTYYQKDDLHTAPCLARPASAMQCSKQFNDFLYSASDYDLCSDSPFFNPKIHPIRKYVTSLNRTYKDVNPLSIARLSLAFPNIRTLNLFIRYTAELAAINVNDDRVMAKLQNFTKLQELILTGFAITSKSLQFLPASLKRLDLARISMSEDMEMQYLSHTSLEDLTLRFIKQLKGAHFDMLPPSLTQLKCACCDLSDEAISKLQKIPLESLYISCDAVTGIHFQNLPQTLKKLTCWDCPCLTDAALNLSTTQLQDIYIWQNDNITGKYFVAPKTVKSITIYHAKNLSHELILGCSGTSLEKIELYNTPITGQYFDQLPSSVKILKCNDCPNITQNVLTNLGGCTCLELLSIDNLEIENPNVYPLPESVKNLCFKNSYWKKIDGKFYPHTPDES
jgi:hypothetical protein